MNTGENAWTFDIGWANNSLEFSFNSFNFYNSRFRNNIHTKWQAIWDSNPHNKLLKIYHKLSHFPPLHQSYTRKDQVILNILLIGHTSLTYLTTNNPKLQPLFASDCVVECQICKLEVADSNFGRGYFALRSTQRSIPPGIRASL